MRWIASLRDDAAACEPRGARKARPRLTGYGAGYAGRGLVVIVALAGGLLVSSPAIGDVPQGGAAPEARSAHAQNGVDALDGALNKGIELFRAGRYKEAEKVFLSEWKVHGTYADALNLGQTELQLNKVLEAAEHLSFALRNWPLVGEHELRKFAEEGFAKTKAQVATLAIRVDRPGAEVSIDGKRVEEKPLPPEVYVSPGRHRIEVMLAGYEPANTTVEVAKGASREVKFTLRPVESEEGKKSRALLITGSALSVAALGAGAGLIVMSSSKLGDATSISERIRADGGGCLAGKEGLHKGQCDELRSTLETREGYINWGIAALAVGGTIGAATITYLVWPSSKPEERKGVRMTPIVTNSGGGFGVMGNF